MNKDIEIRSYRASFNADENESRVIRGLAIPVESRSELLGGEFYEIVKREAVNEDLIKNNDVKLYINHDSQQGVFARSKYGTGSLRLFIDENGLNFETELPDNALGNYLLDAVRRKDIDSVSFAFRVKDEEWRQLPDGTYERSIKSFDILDEISCLYVDPAYPATKVNVRSLDQFKEELRAEQEKEAERINEENNKKFEELENDLNNLYKTFLDLEY